MDAIDKHVDQALRREPDFKLPSGFADGLVKIIEESRQRERKWERIWIGFGAFLFIVALIVVLVLVDFKPTITGVSYLTSHYGLVAFAILFLVILQWVDKKFVRKSQEA